MNVKRVKNVKRARCTRETALHFGLNIEYVFVTLASENKAFLIFFLSTAADLATLGRRSFFFVCLRRLPSYKNPRIQRKTNCNPFRSEIFHIPQFNKISKNAQASLVLKERLRSLETGLWLASTSLSSFHFFLCQPSGFAFFILGESFVAVSGNSSSNVDIVANLFLSASVRSAFPGRTLTAVLTPASKAAFASARLNTWKKNT